MYTINEKDLTIELNETLSFDAHVQPIFDDIREDVRADVEDTESIEAPIDLEKVDEDLENKKQFLQHELTHGDKFSILGLILNDYEYESCRADCEVSIFDEDGIRKGINDWIESKFYFRCD